MYEIVMSTGDRAECDTIEACLVTARTLYDDAFETRIPRVRPRVSVVRDSVSIGEPGQVSAHVGTDLRVVLNRHLREVRP